MNSELWTILHGLQLARYRGFDKVILERLLGRSGSDK